MDEIKLSKLGVNLTSAKVQQPAVNQQTQKNKIEGVTLTNHLSKLVNLLSGDETSPEESARVLATKTLIDSGQYTVDIHSLSEKLLNSGLLSRGD